MSETGNSLAESEATRRRAESEEPYMPELHSSDAPKRKARHHGHDVEAPSAKRPKRGVAKKVKQSKPEDKIETKKIQVHDSDIEEAVRASTKSKRVTRSTSKPPGKEPADKEPADKGDKGAGGTKRSTGGSKATTKSTGTSSTRTTTSKVKKATGRAPPKGKGKKDVEQPKNRSKAGLKKPKIAAKYDVRRILAQRDVDDETFYIVDWYPSWVKARAVRQPNIDDWEANRARYVFQWGEDTVYKVGNPTNDTSPELARQLIESVLQMYQTYMSQTPAEVSADLFEHDDWEFCRAQDRDNAIQAAADANDAHPNITAAEVMQHTFIEAWNQVNEAPRSGRARRYGNIRVQFTGEIDEEASSHRFQPDGGMTTVEFIEPIFADGFWDQEYMNVANWDVQGTDATQVPAHVDVLQPLVADLVTQCPYLLKKPWPLMFISLFYWDREVKDLFADSDFEFELVGARKDPNRWACRARDLIIYTYMDECEWEMRCMDEVNESFVQAQDFIEGALAVARGAAGSDDDDDDEEGPSAAPTDKGKGKARAVEGSSGEGPSDTRNDKGKGSAKAKKTDSGERPSGTHGKK